MGAVRRDHEDLLLSGVDPRICKKVVGSEIVGFLVGHEVRNSDKKCSVYALIHFCINLMTRQAGCGGGILQYYENEPNLNEFLLKFQNFSNSY